MRRTLVVRLDSMGDVLLAGPAVRAAAAGAEVTLLCGPRGRAAAALLPGVRAILEFHAPWIDPDGVPVDGAAIAGLLERLRAGRFDDAAILTSFHQSALPLALLLRLAGVPRIAAISEDYPGTLLDERLPEPGDIHEVERALRVVRALGHEPPSGDAGRLRVIREPARRPAGLPARYVVVHPGASVPARAWPAARHAELVRALAGRGRAVVVTGAPAEASLAHRVAGPPHPGVLDLAGRTDLAGLAHVLAGADALVAANTGPAHLAAAVGTPVVSLFARTVPPARWRPWRVPHVLLGADVPCAGCRARACPVPGHPCLRVVSVDEVLAALERLPAPAVPQEVAA